MYNYGLLKLEYNLLHLVIKIHTLVLKSHMNTYQVSGNQAREKKFLILN